MDLHSRRDGDSLTRSAARCSRVERGLFTLGLLLFLAGQLLFLKNLFLLLRVYGEPRRQAAIGFFTGAEALGAGGKP